MYLKQKINTVNALFRQADRHVSGFQAKSKLTCISNCNYCCTKADIETTIIEFLPAAYHLFITDEYNQVLDNIENKTDESCVFFNPFNPSGACTYYAHRGMLCRLFGFSRKTGKDGSLILTTCKPLKASIDLASIQPTLKHAPELANYYLKLFGIDQKLSVQYFPINQSIRKAIEIVVLHFQYRKKPA